MRPIHFYQQHLDQVSRSFAFCISRLEGDLRLWVSMSYLLCRVLDTIEDAIWSDKKKQQAVYALFQDFMRQPPSKETVRAWCREFPEALPQGEAALLADCAELFADFHDLPEPVRKKIHRSVLNMYRGMIHYSSLPRLELKSLAEVNQYCFFVAGIVGELLSDLMAEKEAIFQDKEKIYLLSHHFGLFLQKVNLLKDQKKDAKEARFLIHSRKEVFSSLKENADGAMAYIQNIPLEQQGYRLFCAWSFFLGLASLPWIERSWYLGFLGKMPRTFAKRVFQKVEDKIDSNEDLAKMYADYKLKGFAEISAAKPVAALPWFKQAYLGELSPSHLQQLRLFS